MHASLFSLIALPLFMLADKNVGGGRVVKWQRIITNIILFIAVFSTIYILLAIIPEIRLARPAIIEMFRLASLVWIVESKFKIFETTLSFLLAEVACVIFSTALFLDVGGADYFYNSLYFSVLGLLLVVLSSFAYKFYSYRPTRINAIYSFLALAFLRWVGDRELSGTGALSDIALEWRMLILVVVLSLMLVFGTVSRFEKSHEM